MIGTWFFSIFGGASPSGSPKLCSSWAANGSTSHLRTCLGMQTPVIRGFHGQIRWTKMLTWDTNIYIYTIYLYMQKEARYDSWHVTRLEVVSALQLGKKETTKCKVSRRNASSKHMVSTDLFFFGKFTTMKISTRESMFTELMSDDVVVSFSSLKFQGFHFCWRISEIQWPLKKTHASELELPTPQKHQWNIMKPFPYHPNNMIYTIHGCYGFEPFPQKKSSTWNWKQKVPDFYTTKTQPFQWQNRGLNPQSAGVPAPRITASSGEVQMLGIQVLTSCHEQQNMYSEPYSFF